LPKQFHHHCWLEDFKDCHHLAKELEQDTLFDGMRTRCQEQDVQQLDEAQKQLTHSMVGGGELPCWFLLQGLHIGREKKGYLLSASS
jgi:hypothetical protein